MTLRVRAREWPWQHSQFLQSFFIAGLKDGVDDEYDSSNGDHDDDDDDNDDDLTKSGQSRSGWSKVTQSRRLYFTPGDQRAFPHMRKCALHRCPHHYRYHIIDVFIAFKCCNKIMILIIFLMGALPLSVLFCMFCWETAMKQKYLNWWWRGWRGRGRGG